MIEKLELHQRGETQVALGDRYSSVLFQLLEPNGQKDSVILEFDHECKLEIERESSTFIITVNRGTEPQIITPQINYNPSVITKLEDEQSDLEIALYYGDETLFNPSAEQAARVLKDSALTDFRLDISGRGLLIDQGMTGIQLRAKKVDGNWTVSMCNLAWNGESAGEYLSD